MLPWSIPLWRDPPRHLSISYVYVYIYIYISTTLDQVKTETTVYYTPLWHIRESEIKQLPIYIASPDLMSCSSFPPFKWSVSCTYWIINTSRQLSYRLNNMILYFLVDRYRYSLIDSWYKPTTWHIFRTVSQAVVTMINVGWDSATSARKACMKSSPDLQQRCWTRNTPIRHYAE